MFNLPAKLKICEIACKAICFVNNEMQVNALDN